MNWRTVQRLLAAAVDWRRTPASFFSTHLRRLVQQVCRLPCVSCCRYRICIQRFVCHGAEALRCKITCCRLTVFFTLLEGCVARGIATSRYLMRCAGATCLPWKPQLSLDPLPLTGSASSTPYPLAPSPASAARDAELRDARTSSGRVEALDLLSVVPHESAAHSA